MNNKMKIVLWAQGCIEFIGMTVSLLLKEPIPSFLWMLLIVETSTEYKLRNIIESQQETLERMNKILKEIDNN